VREREAPPSFGGNGIDVSAEAEEGNGPPSADHAPPLMEMGMALRITLYSDFV